jgi:hypothetical protein
MTDREHVELVYAILGGDSDRIERLVNWEEAVQWDGSRWTLSLNLRQRSAIQKTCACCGRRLDG